MATAEARRAVAPACAACGVRSWAVVRPSFPWEPRSREERAWRGAGAERHLVHVDTSIHAPGTVACLACHPCPTGRVLLEELEVAYERSHNRRPSPWEGGRAPWAAAARAEATRPCPRCGGADREALTGGDPAWRLAVVACGDLDPARGCGHCVVAVNEPAPSTGETGTWFDEEATGRAEVDEEHRAESAARWEEREAAGRAWPAVRRPDRGVTIAGAERAGDARPSGGRRSRRRAGPGGERQGSGGREEGERRTS